MNKKFNKKIDFKYNLKVYLKLIYRYRWIVLLILFLSVFMESRVVIDRFLFKVIIDKGNINSISDFNNKNNRRGL